MINNLSCGFKKFEVIGELWGEDNPCQGFEIIGFDTCCYTNDDIGRREVRINLGFFYNREGRRR